MLKADLTMAGRLRESYLKVQMGRRLVAGRLLIGILQPGLGGAPPKSVIYGRMHRTHEADPDFEVCA